MSRVNTENMVSLKVDNLPFKCTQDDVYKAFNKFGDVGDVFIPLNRDKRSRGFAFVR